MLCRLNNSSCTICVHAVHLPTWPNFWKTHPIPFYLFWFCCCYFCEGHSLRSWQLREAQSDFDGPEVNSVDHLSVTLWRRANARNVRLYYPYWQYTDLFLYLYYAYVAHYVYYSIAGSVYNYAMPGFQLCATQTLQVCLPALLNPNLPQSHAGSGQILTRNGFVLFFWNAGKWFHSFTRSFWNVSRKRITILDRALTVPSHFFSFS